MRAYSIAVGDCRNINNSNSNGRTIGIQSEAVDLSQPFGEVLSVSSSVITTARAMHSGIRRHANGHGSSENCEEPVFKKRHVETNNPTIQQSSIEQFHGSAVLEPFVHQVTGRSHMLSLNSSTLCKSLLPRELLFYTSLNEDLRRFTPELKGVLYAQLEQSPDAHSYKFTTTQLFLKSNPSQVMKASEGIELPNSLEGTGQSPPNTDALQWYSTYEKILFKGLERVKYDLTNGFTSHPWTVDKDSEAITDSVGVNPWAVRQHRREINRMLSRDGASPDRAPLPATLDANGNAVDNGGKSSDCSPGKFLRGYLMLEDVTSRFKHPNVLDLKLGRQIERDDCSQEKKDKHVQLANHSSTGTLLLRLAGMQVYQVDSGHYLCRNKYYGRGLSSDGFKESLHQFLHNGRSTIVEVISPVIEGLITLREALKRQETFRFYASSLLISYEGGEEEESRAYQQQDGAYCPNSTNGGANVNGLSDTDGLANDEIPKVSTKRDVDVRMIDFAHSTYKGFNGDKTSHDGPDNDCLEAITNLVKLLKEIESEVSSVTTDFSKESTASEVEGVQPCLNLSSN